MTNEQLPIDPVDVIQVAMDCIPNTLEGVMTRRRVVHELRAYFDLHGPLASQPTRTTPEGEQARLDRNFHALMTQQPDEESGIPTAEERKGAARPQGEPATDGEARLREELESLKRGQATCLRALETAVGEAEAQSAAAVREALEEIRAELHVSLMCSSDGGVQRGFTSAIARIDHRLASPRTK